jgi:hypothetical protein
LTTSKDGLKTLNINVKTNRIELHVGWLIITAIHEQDHWLFSILLSSNVLIVASTRQIKSKSFRKGSEKSSVMGTIKNKKALIINQGFLFVLSESDSPL